MIWLKRTTAILALTFGAGLLWMPFPGEISGESMREVVVLEVDKAPFSVEEARAQFSETILELSYENLDQTPEFREAVLGVYGRGGEQCFSTAEWDFLLSDWGLVSGEGSVFTFRDGLHRINRVEEVVDDSEGPYTCIEVKLLGTYDNREWEGMTHLDEAVLADYPEIDAEVRRLADGVIPAAGGEAIKVRKWRHFHRRELDDLEYRPRWVVFDRLFSGAVEDVEAPWTLNTPWLRGSAMGVGIALAFIGFVAFARVYRGLGSRPGIAVGGAGLAVFGDVIALTGGCLGAVGCIEAFWVGVLELPSLLGYVPEYSLGSALSPYAFISILGMGLGMPFFTFWITVLTGQRVHVDSEGVTSWGVFGRSYVPWDELEMIHVREQRSAAMWTTGDYRALQRVLEIEGENTSITINQPTSAKRKASILVALLEHIPAGLRHLLEVADDW